MAPLIVKAGLMTDDDVIHALRARRAVRSKCFGVAEHALFGSFARHQASNKSVVDMLVRFCRAIRWERYLDAEFCMEDILGRPKGLVTEKDLRPQLRVFVEREIVNV